MKIDELEKSLLDLLKKCSKLSFREQLAFLLNEARKASDDDLKVVVYLYINYLIEQQNVRGQTPFILPPLSEIREVSSRVKDSNVELDDLVAVSDAPRKIDLGKSLYNEPVPVSNGNNSSPSLYSSPSLKYENSYTPSQPMDDYLSSQGLKKPDFEKPLGGLEKNLESPEPEKRFDAGSGKPDYVVRDFGGRTEESKKAEKKVLYGA